MRSRRTSRGAPSDPQDSQSQIMGCTSHVDPRPRKKVSAISDAIISFMRPHRWIIRLGSNCGGRHIPKTITETPSQIRHDASWETSPKQS